jgi:hypothetical protein
MDMAVHQTAWQEGEKAAAVLGPEADYLTPMDAAGLGEATFNVLMRAAQEPADIAAAAARFWTSLAMAGPAAAAHRRRSR